MTEPLRPWKRRQLAMEFAMRAARLCETDWAHNVRGGDGNEHKGIREDAKALLTAFLGDHKINDPGKFAYEGAGKGGLAYQLLGTEAHPDAAVLSPFRCAIEFDRQGASGWSDFKTALLKAAVHSISGAYDATLFVYTLRRTEASLQNYLEDYEPPWLPSDVAVAPTQTLLSRLTELGVVWAFVPPLEAAAT